VSISKGLRVLLKDNPPPQYGMWGLDCIAPRRLPLVGVRSMCVPCVALPSGGGSSAGSSPLCGSLVGGVLPCRVPVSRGFCSSSCLSLALTLSQSSYLSDSFPGVHQQGSARTAQGQGPNGPQPRRGDDHQVARREAQEEAPHYVSAKDPCHKPQTGMWQNRESSPRLRG